MSGARVFICNLLECMFLDLNLFTRVLYYFILKSTFFFLYITAVFDTYGCVCVWYCKNTVSYGLSRLLVVLWFVPRGVLCPESSWCLTSKSLVDTTTIKTTYVRLPQRPPLWLDLFFFLLIDNTPRRPV